MVYRESMLQIGRSNGRVLLFKGDIQLDHGMCALSNDIPRILIPSVRRCTSYKGQVEFQAPGVAGEAYYVPLECDVWVFIMDLATLLKAGIVILEESWELLLKFLELFV